MAARRTCDRMEDSTRCTCKYYDWMSNQSTYNIVTGPQSHRTCQGYQDTDACQNTVGKPKMPTQGLTRTCWPLYQFITL